MGFVDEDTMPGLRQILNVREAQEAFAVMATLSTCRLESWLLFRAEPERRWEIYVNDENYDAAVYVMACVTRAPTAFNELMAKKDAKRRRVAKKVGNKKRRGGD